MLDFSQEKVLEVKTRDGKTLRLKPKRLKVKESKAFTQSVDELEAKRAKGEIENDEFLLQILSKVIVDFKEEDFADFYIDELREIFDSIVALRDKRTEQEKKTQ